MSPVLPSRRIALHVIAATAAIPIVGCAAADPSGGHSNDPEPFGDVLAGNVAEIPENTLRPVNDAPVILGRDSGGLYAMTSTCTHAGCDMIADGRVNADGVVCGCHNSHFDRNGRVTSGPARAPLQHFAVSVDSTGAITVHGAEPVEGTQRTLLS
jgi:Rieske Fe-S protein